MTELMVASHNFAKPFQKNKRERTYSPYQRNANNLALQTMQNRRNEGAMNI
jgi:hypothetical protein